MEGQASNVDQSASPGTPVSSEMMESEIEALVQGGMNLVKRHGVIKHDKLKGISDSLSAVS
jgi:hypothetical protein